MFLVKLLLISVAGHYFLRYIELSAGSRKLPGLPMGASHPGCGSQRLLRYRLHPAGRCPNSSSLFPPLAAVVAVAPSGGAGAKRLRGLRHQLRKLGQDLVAEVFQLCFRLTVRSRRCLCSRLRERDRGLYGRNIQPQRGGG